MAALRICNIVFALVVSSATAIGQVTDDEEEELCRITETGRLVCERPERPKLSDDAADKEFFGSGSGTGMLLSARLFAGPNSYPPDAYRGYGIMVFPSKATAFDRDRHLMICSAFWSSLPATDALTVPLEDQFVTIWPLTDDEMGERIRRQQLPEACETAVDHYNHDAALRAAAAARPSGFEARQRGPYLLAWSPPSDIDRPGAFVLSLDFSGADSYDEVLALMRDWTRDIETDFEILSNGFSVDRLRVKIRRWADRYGDGFLRALKGGG